MDGVELYTSEAYLSHITDRINYDIAKQLQRVDSSTFNRFQRACVSVLSLLQSHQFKLHLSLSEYKEIQSLVTIVSREKSIACACAVQVCLARLRPHHQNAVSLIPLPDLRAAVRAIVGPVAFKPPRSEAACPFIRLIAAHVQQLLRNGGDLRPPLTMSNSHSKATIIRLNPMTGVPSGKQRVSAGSRRKGLHLNDDDPGDENDKDAEEGHDDLDSSLDSLVERSLSPVQRSLSGKKRTTGLRLNHPTTSHMHQPHGHKVSWNKNEVDSQPDYDTGENVPQHNLHKEEEVEEGDDEEEPEEEEPEEEEPEEDVVEEEREKVVKEQEEEVVRVKTPRVQRYALRKRRKRL